MKASRRASLSEQLPLPRWCRRGAARPVWHRQGACGHEGVQRQERARHHVVEERGLAGLQEDEAAQDVQEVEEVRSVARQPAHGLHAVAPGTRLASNMAPTTGRSADGSTLAVGSPGADRITTALMLVLGQGCLHDRDLQSAIDAPRIHLRQVEDGFVVEHERDEAIAAAVARSGLPSHEYPEPHMYFGGVGAAAVSPSGELQAAGDARREAATGISG